MDMNRKHVSNHHGAEIETMIEEVSNSQRQVLNLCKEHRSAAWLKTKLAG